MNHSILSALLLVALVAGCPKQGPAQLPLGGDRECSWSPDIALQCCSNHDNAYWVGGTEQDREWADRELYWCMIAYDVPKAIAKAYYSGVRQFGGSSWNYTEERSRRGEIPESP
jgi:hypothetical protein